MISFITKTTHCHVCNSMVLYISYLIHLVYMNCAADEVGGYKIEQTQFKLTLGMNACPVTLFHHLACNAYNWISPGDR